jgi:hypothetical protein
MRIVYHLGAHCTDEDRLVRCLLKNRAALAEEGIVVPSPTRYRSLLRDTAMQLNGAAASADTQALILEQILDEPEAERMVLSWDSFLGFPGWAVRETLYPHAGERSRAFSQIFPDARAEFHLAIRNPVTFLPTLRDKVLAKGQGDIMTGVDPLTLNWSTAVSQILYHNPEVPLTVWCDEDTPLIWPEVLRGVSGHREDTVLADTDELLSLIMTQDGLARMKGYLAAHPPAGVGQRRRAVTAFLEKFAQPDQIDMEFEMPGWTPDLVSRLTDRYRTDIERIRSMPGVQFLAP